MSRALVTGAGGFIGRHTLAPLAAAGYEVHAVTSRPLRGDSATVGTALAEAGSAEGASVETAPTDSVSGVSLPGVRWHHADLLDPGSVGALLREVRPSHLLHMAWYTTQPGGYWTALANLDWVSASLRLLRAFGEGGGQRAVIAGTCVEYRWQRHTHCVETLTPIEPTTLYGAAKHSLHVAADAWARQEDVALAWGRMFHLHGPHEHPERLVASVARAVLRGEEARCTHGRQVRDYLHVRDAGAAFAALLASEVTGPVNAASGEAVRVGDVVTAVARAAGRPELVRLGARPADPGEPERLTADVRRLREEVGWAPTMGLREGAEQTVAWWRRALAAEGASEGRPQGADVRMAKAAGARAASRSGVAGTRAGAR
jgi:nucleoside-diphosphate-sugar epimerase